MHLWLSRRSPVSLREQIATQIMLGVISEDLKPGERVPSVREFARFHRVHANTVSAAYQDLVQRGWLETRHGSGVYVRVLPPPAPLEGRSPLDQLIADFLAEAGAQGFSTAIVRNRIAQWRESDRVERVVVVEPEPELGEVLCHEIRAAVALPVNCVSAKSDFDGAAAVSLVSRASYLDRLAPPGVPRVLLKLHSVAGAMKGQPRPPASAILTVASHSPEILRWTRTMLLAAAIDPVALDVRDAREPGWKRGLKVSAVIVTDPVTVRKLPPGLPVRVFRVIADTSLEELKKLVAL